MFSGEIFRICPQLLSVGIRTHDILDSYDYSAQLPFYRLLDCSTMVDTDPCFDLVISFLVSSLVFLNNLIGGRFSLSQ
jgi:hypothetical protein